ncbi:MAG: PASTA domain-containing protein [Cyanobacteria bacterium J06643_13]
MNKTFLVTASLFALGAAQTVNFTSAHAAEVDCVNYWVNPQNQLVQCFDRQLNYLSLPLGYWNNSPSLNLEPAPAKTIRRRATDSAEMIMPDLIGSEIDAAEDYLLGMGINLGSNEVYAQNRNVGEVIRQSPPPGTKLTKDQTVLLEYMGASVNSTQVQ